ncbi:MAG: SMC-Scp complex subunit ScpB, partial [Chloroflexi bacterium]|nr:SMC-Scp complex subunit ScpB [Chloroflexota bacterium]
MSDTEKMEPEESILPPPTPEQIPALLEALLFVADEPVEVRSLASVLGVDVAA